MLERCTHLGNSGGHRRLRAHIHGVAAAALRLLIRTKAWGCAHQHVLHPAAAGRRHTAAARVRQKHGNLRALTASGAPPRLNFGNDVAWSQVCGVWGGVRTKARAGAAHRGVRDRGLLHSRGQRRFAACATPQTHATACKHSNGGVSRAAQLPLSVS